MSTISRVSTLKSSIPMTVSKKTVTSSKMDAEWLEVQAAQKHPAKFRVLYERYYEQIFRFIYRRTTDEMLTADLCSQVFLKALQKLGKYQFKGVPFSAWLYRIASNEVAQHYRNTKKQRVVSTEEHNLSDLVEEDNENPLEVYKAHLSDALEELKPTEVQLIELRFFEKRAFKEIAHILEITESNAKVKTYRLLTKLKKILAKKAK